MTDVEGLLEQLDTILDGEVAAYERLLQLQQAEQRLCVAQALAPFLENLQAKECQANTISALERQRTNTVAVLASILGAAASDLSLQQLSDRLEAPYARRFLDYRTRLRTVLVDLQRVNRDNEILLRDSLAFIEGALTFFAQLIPDNLTYRPSGGFSPCGQGRLISGRI